MKKVIKWVIAGAIIIGIGLAIVLGTLAFNGWSIKKPTFEMQTYTATEDNSAIDFTVSAGSVRTEFYDGDKITVEYPSSSVFKSEIKEKDSKLRYESKLKKTLFWGNISIPDTIIKLPKDINFDVEFEVNAGSVKIAEGVYGIIEIEVNAGTLSASGLECTKFDCDVNAGKLDVKKLDCADIKAEVNAGSIEIGIDGAKADYTIKASVSAGSCNVSNQSGSTDKKLDVDCSAGSIKVNFAS